MNSGLIYFSRDYGFNWSEYASYEVVTGGAYSLAFAGGGTLSRKEALDAAHGHEHNADGSEISRGTPPSDEAAHDHGDAHDHHDSTSWKILSAVLFVALVTVSFLKSRQR